VGFEQSDLSLEVRRGLAFGIRGFGSGSHVAPHDVA